MSALLRRRGRPLRYVATGFASWTAAKRAGLLAER